MANENPNVEALVKHAKSKTEATLLKVENSLKNMIKKQMKINFNSVSEESGVSKAFLYKNLELRERIDTLRRQQEGLSSPKQVKRNTSDASKDVIIATLRRRIKDLEKENKELKEQIKVQLGKVYQQI